MRQAIPVSDEPTLDEMLADETMRCVLLSAGLGATELRQLLLDLARRLEPAVTPRYAYSAAIAARRPAA
jgi:hypothetical protein